MTSHDEPLQTASINLPSISDQLLATFQRSALTFQGNVPQTYGFCQSIALSFIYLETNFHVCDINTLPVMPKSVPTNYWIVVSIIRQQYIFADQLLDSLKSERHNLL